MNYLTNADLAEVASRIARKASSAASMAMPKAIRNEMVTREAAHVFITEIVELLHIIERRTGLK